ncbi:hypothetical protein IJG72_06915 [bacterium]|nr:hypothetical protein [bacterium]
MLRVESINKSNINYPPKIYKHKVFENFGSNIAKNSFTSDGFDILANYNFSSMNINNDFDIPKIDIIQYPKNLSQLDGDKIYSSNNQLTAVIKQNEDNKYIYYNDKYKTVRLFDNKSGNILKEQVTKFNEINNIPYTIVSQFDKNNVYKSIYLNDNDKLTLIEKSKSVKFDNGLTKIFINDAINNKFSIIEDFSKKADKGFRKRLFAYDEQKHLNYANESDINTQSEISIKYYNDTPIGISKNKVMVGLQTSEADDVNLKPTKYFNIPENVQNLDGIKTYYSNKAIETNQVGDTKYYFNLEGKVIKIETPNKVIALANDDTKYQCIEEKLNDNSVKVTYIGPSEDKDFVRVEYYLDDGNNKIFKNISMIDGKILDYQSN